MRENCKKTITTLAACVVAGTIGLSLTACGTTAAVAAKPAPTVTVTAKPAAPAIVMTAGQLDTSITGAGDWTSIDETTKTKATSAQCESDGANALGVGRFQCVVNFTVVSNTDGTDPVGTQSQESEEIVVGADGSWVTNTND
jgi:hypothetical protein